jgi:protein TonB
VPAVVAKPRATAPAPTKEGAVGSAEASLHLMATWGRGIQRAIARQSVQGRGLPKGTVLLVLSVETNGRIASIRLGRSSGHDTLDKAAIAAVGRARLPAAPKGMATGRHVFTLPVASR